MATTKLIHPNHDHPLVPLDLSNEPYTRSCELCRRRIYGEAYTCHEGCHYYHHRVCAEAPPQIERHPLHPAHPLPLIHGPRPFTCDCCFGYFNGSGRSFWFNTPSYPLPSIPDYTPHGPVDSLESSFRCDECDFNLDICCALSSLSDEGGSLGGKTSEQIAVPLHPHPLTSFSTRHDFVGDSDCKICQESVEGDGYTCLRPSCEFIIHKGCIQDLYYADGTKAPRVNHSHPLETFVGDDAGSRTCSGCGSDKSGEFIGCTSCEVFYHRNCVQVPEILRYPSHHPDHTLVPFINCPDIGTLRQCQSCSRSLKDELCYRCTSCEFFMHVGCAFQVLTYCEEGMSAKIELSWHKHPLLLCHRTESASDDCFYCGDELTGPTYACNVEDCGFLLHRRCTEIESTINHPHHPDHPLTLCEMDDRYAQLDGPPPFCEACRHIIQGLRFFCERCLFDLHIKCAAHFPNQKHYLHEHKLLRFDKVPASECNRCGTSTDSPSFRCVPCDFNLHKKCMELPQVVKSEIHRHPLTLHETYVEDDSGEYYCDRCEKRRDVQLGAYVCGQCTARWVFHIECVPELGKVYAKKSQPFDVEILNDRIVEKKKDIRAIEEKLEEAKREFDELELQRAKLIAMKRMSCDPETEKYTCNVM